MIGFFIDLALFIMAITYAVKYYKFKKMAELEFINYEKRLQESDYKVKESEYMYESGVKLYQSENVELDPDEENRKIKEQQVKKSLLENNGQGSFDLGPIIEKINKIYKEKEDELEKRMEAENQVNLALQKIETMEVKIEDFRKMQSFSVDSFKKIAASLYKKIRIDINNIGKS